ncbi:MAG: SRPBCC family protein [Candidatus Delongbacteria bacterium]
MIRELSFETRFRQSPEELFPFFAEAANLERLTPDALRFRILTPPPLVMRPDLRIDYRLRLHGLSFRWRTRITRWEPPRLFQDLQERGPWALWEHTHDFTPLPGGGTLMTDRLRLRPPFGLLGRLLWPLLAREVAGIFAHRERVLRSLFGPPPVVMR